METVSSVVGSIIAMLTDRRGFRQTWDECDGDIQSEIEASLHEIVSQLVAIPSDAASGETARVPVEIDRAKHAGVLAAWNECMANAETLEMTWPKLVRAAQEDCIDEFRERICSALGEHVDTDVDRIVAGIEYLRAKCREAPPSAAGRKDSPGKVLIDLGVIQWMLGECEHPETGLWFERPLNEPRFWWRKYLRAAIAATDSGQASSIKYKCHSTDGGCKNSPCIYPQCYRK